MIVSRDPFDSITDEQWAQLGAAYPNALRIRVAMQLAGDVDTFAAVYRGEPVEPTRLDPHGLNWARRQRLVRLDVRALDSLAGAVA